MKIAPHLRPRIQRDIETITNKILRELGHPEPPLDLAMVRELQKLDLAYFSTEKDGLLRSTVSKLKRGTKQLLKRPGLLIDAVRKFDLKALYLPDEKRVLIDDGTPKLKHRWLEAHEIGHDLLPWHCDMMLGDDDSTVSVTAHAKIEAEANHAAGSLLFMGDRLREQCRSIEDPKIADVMALKKEFGNTITTTLWRVVEHSGEDRPILGLIGCHPGNQLSADATMFRHLILSRAFRDQFPDPDVWVLASEIRTYCGWRKRGPLGDAEVILRDHDGTRHLFRFETFFNGHDALTMGVWIREVSTIVAVA